MHELAALLASVPASLRSTAIVEDVPPSSHLCPWCMKHVYYIAGKHDPMAAVIGIDPHTGDISVWHQYCRMQAKGDMRSAMARPTKKPDCAVCGEKFKQHIRLNVPPYVQCNRDLVNNEPQAYVPAVPRTEKAAA